MARTYRIQTPVKPETRKAIEGYAEALGVAPAVVAGIMLEEAAPALLELTRAIKKAHSSPSKGLMDMASVISRAAEDADQVAMDFVNQSKEKRAR